jgi:hypothetical protein
MAMDADSGIIRMLQEGEKQKVNELLSIKGCIFSIKDISVEEMILHPETKDKFHFIQG